MTTGAEIEGAISLGMMTATKLEEARGKEQFSPGARGESVALPGYSHQTCDNLLQQPQEINSH